ncbi:b7b3b32f-562d-4d73-9a99-8e4132b54bf0-CDS [Sclerotinia trifoliorum]|uniref:B7b3b32f-562d-4d73-9a99-8e4132b54bf0-CDS n=1 Tax=Sclerotinia trifoliorum TaxID=28548 RepID=A0A8H2ZLQ0_9HELO|nr:b7b3b32f-562d-4d73-9a99-8e4132b54bf0-CDS [Sclerotinia trifoliorum]
MIHLRRDALEIDDDFPSITQSEERNRQPILADEPEMADEAPSAAQPDERHRRPIQLVEPEIADELPSVVRPEEIITPIPQANTLSQETANVTYYCRVLQSEERNTPSPEPIMPGRESVDDDVYIRNAYQQAERNNTPSEDRIMLSRDVPDELPPSIRYGLQLRDTSNPEPDSPKLSIIDTKQLSHFNDLSDNYLELIEFQDAMHSKLGIWESLHEDLRTEFEARVHRIPGLSKFSLPYRERQKYERSTFRPLDAKDERRCECAGCFNVLASQHANAVRVSNIILDERSLLKKEHLELLEEFETFLNHRKALIASIPITRMEWDVDMVFKSS